MSKLTYCPQCWSVVSKTDTTCCQCGEAISPDHNVEIKGSDSIAPFVCIGGVLWFIVLCLAYFNGWLA